MARSGRRWHAAFYDSIMRASGHRLDELRRFAAGGASGRVVEIGCGTGLNFDFYDWDRVESLDATEPDPFMLERARRRLDRLAAEIRERVHLHEAPAEALPFGDASFDSAVSTLVLCTVDDPHRACAELLRVLKPGANARLVEHVGGSGMLGTVQRVLQPLWSYTAGGCHLNNDTEEVLAASAFRVEVVERFSMSALLPAIRVIATREPEQMT